MTSNSSERETMNEARKAALADFANTCNTMVARVGRVQRRWLIALGLSFAMIVALTVGLIIGWVEARHAEEELRRTQSVQSERVLCPLYRIFINADTPAAREAAIRSGQDPVARDNSFKVIREGYAALECQPVLSPDGRLTNSVR